MATQSIGDAPRPRWLVVWIAGSALALGLAACGGGGGPAPSTPAVLGGPIPGLSAAQLATFQRGRDVFERRFTPSSGLGPFYNATSCRSCHSTPVTGGSSQLYRNFYMARFGTKEQLGGQQDMPNLPSPVIPAFGDDTFHSIAQFHLDAPRAQVPEGPTFNGQPLQVAQRNGIPLFGVGLFERVSDATIAGLADPNDRDSDGISGRWNQDGTSIGRFGVKAQSNNIELFTRAPFQNQMGITTDPADGAGGIVGQQASVDPNAPTRDADGVTDPELSEQDLRDVMFFTRNLAPPAKLAFNAAATRGELLFDSLGCVKCHVPSLPSSRGSVEAYTDLLLHDMGTDLADGIGLGTPQPSTLQDPSSHEEFRTQPLWGVRHHAPFLHDGRAGTLLEAILLHGGEAQSIRDAFAALSPNQQADVVAFLEHL